MNKQELKSKEGRLSKLVQEFMDNKRAISDYNAKQAILKTKIEARMVVNNSKVLFYNDEYVQKCPNPTVSINVAKFKNATNGKEFMQCIKVDGSKLVTGSIVE
jgi:hypothetical protein